MKERGQRGRCAERGWGCEIPGMNLLTALISSIITQKKHCQVLFFMKDHYFFLSRTTNLYLISEICQSLCL